MVSIQDDHLSEVSLFAICLLLFVFFPILIHDHIDEHESESTIECQLCKNKAFDLQNADSKVSEFIQTSFLEELLGNIASTIFPSVYLFA